MWWLIPWWWILITALIALPLGYMVGVIVANSARMDDAHRAHLRSMLEEARDREWKEGA
jgi:hypothetical protein